MSEIHLISLIILGLLFLLGCIRPIYALPLVLVIQLLIPNAIKFNVGINLNVFNLSVFLFCIVTYMHRTKKQGIVGLKKVLTAYSVFVIATSVFSEVGLASAKDYIQNSILFLLEYILIGYCFTHIEISEKDYKYINYSVIVCSLVIIAYGILNYITKINPYMLYVSTVASLDMDMANSFMNEQRGVIEGRISSVYTHPLQLGQAALLLFCYTFYELKGKINLILYWALLLGMVLMIVLCGARSAIFPLLMVVFFYIRYHKAKKVVQYLFVGLFATIVVYQSLPEEYAKTVDGMIKVWDDKASEAAGIKGSSKNLRLEQLGSSLDIISDDVLFGLGNGYIKKYGDRHPEMLGYESVVFAKLVEGGLLGLLAFFIFYFATYKIFRRKAVRPMDKARIVSMSGSFLVSILFTGISYSFFSLYLTFCCLTYYSITHGRV